MYSNAEYPAVLVNYQLHPSACVSTVKVGKGKEGCGRVVARKQLGIVKAYTLEASFMGADQVNDLQLQPRDDGLHFLSRNLTKHRIE